MRYISANSIVKKSLLVLSTLCVLFVIQTHLEASTTSVTQYVYYINKKVTSIVVQENATSEEKKRQMKELFYDNVDLKWIGKFAVGKYWRQLSDAQKNDYLNIFPEYVINKYLEHFEDFATHKLNVTDVTETSQDEYVVQTTMTDPASQAKIEVSYRIVKKNDQNTSTFVIFDVMAEGVSMIATQRSEISSYLSNHSFDSLLMDLKAKIANSHSSVPDTNSQIKLDK